MAESSSQSSRARTPLEAAVSLRRKAKKELKRALSKVQRWERKLEELRRLEKAQNDRTPERSGSRSPSVQMKSLKAVAEALEKLPTVELSPEPQESTRRSRSPRRHRRRQESLSPPRASAPAKPPPPEPFCSFQWLQPTVLSQSLSDEAGQALRTLRDAVQRLPSGPESSRRSDGWRRAVMAKETLGHSARVPVPHRDPLRSQREKLPVCQHRAEFLQAVEKNAVVIVEGETGCGKTTQLPQFLLEDAAARKSAVRILVTQPRRVSALSMAARVAEERGEKLGATVGFAICLETCVSHSTCLMYCTQGVLLRQLESDPDLGVTHVFADEIHERSEEGDLLLLLLGELSKRRPEFRLITMSATLDTESLHRYFGRAHVLKLPGKMFEVKTLFLEDALSLTRHRVNPRADWAARQRISGTRYTGTAKFSGASTEDKRTEDLSNHAVAERYGRFCPDVRAALSAMDHDVVNFDLAAEVVAHYVRTPAPKGPAGLQGAILVFLSGAKEIQRMRRALLDVAPDLGKEPQWSWILNLHSSLQQEEQQRVFKRPPESVRKIVLSTNIAETSITIDDVGVVVDTGHVKELRYDGARRMACLEDVFACRASARQRRGRAGRVAPGICVHLVTKFRHDELCEAHQEPEVQRIALEPLLLRVHAAGLPSLLGVSGAAEAASRLWSPPSRQNCARALRHLIRLGALSSEESLTALGARLAHLPLEPRRGTTLLLGASLGESFLEVAATTTAALVINSWPLGGGAFGPEAQRFEAKRKHRRLAEALSFGGLCCSDLLAVLRSFELWDSTRDRRKLCEEQHLRSSALYELADMRRHLLEQLEDSGAIHGIPSLRFGTLQNSGGPMAVALLSASCWPQVALALPKETLLSSLDASTSLAELFVQDESAGSLVPVQVHPSSVSAKEKLFGSPFVLYEELVQTARLYLRTVTPAPALAVALFAGLLAETQRPELRRDGNEGMLNMGAFTLILPWSACEQIMEIRMSLERYLRHWLQHPKALCPRLSAELTTAISDFLRLSAETKQN